MFNTNTPDRSIDGWRTVEIPLAPCVFPVEELCLDSVLAGVMFNGELQIEIDETGDWYIESVTATNIKGVTQVYGNKHPIYEAVCAVVLANDHLSALIYDDCVEHARW